MPRISIIVPVFNAERYLDACLDSLFAQTLREIEVICVDDGSCDRSLHILKQRALSDRRLKVLSQQNAGPGSARNAGMESATGDIVMFCDADDCLEPYACSVISNTFMRDACDVMVFGMKIFPEDELHPSLEGQQYPSDAVLGNSAADHRRLLFASKARPFACRVALSREFANREHVRWHPDLTLADDQYFCFYTYPRSSKTTLCSQQLYLYRMNTSSLTHASQQSTEALLSKMDKHMACETAILKDWEENGFMSLAPVELLSWCLEFVLFDASKLPIKDQRAFWIRWWDSVGSHFDKQIQARLALPTRMCLKDAELCAQSTRKGVAPAHLAFHFIRQRGIIASAKRLLYALRRGR